MKFINYLLALLLLVACERKACQRSVSDVAPEYNMLETFSHHIGSRLGLDLVSYGINNDVPKDLDIVGKTYNFSASYWCYRNPNAEVSMEEARRMIVSITEAMRTAINANQSLQDRLYARPLAANVMRVRVHFVDKKKEDLAQGVLIVSLRNGTLHYYDGTGADEYNVHYHGSSEKIKEVAPFAISQHRELHRETYEDAFEKVKNTDGLIPL